MIPSFFISRMKRRITPIRAVAIREKERWVAFSESRDPERMSWSAYREDDACPRRRCGGHQKEGDRAGD